MIDRRFLLALCGLLILNEWVSFIVSQNSTAGIVAFIMVSLLFLAAALLSTDFALLIVLAELVVGGKGYLYHWDFGGFDFSIRLSFFIILFSVWLLKRRYKKLSFFTSVEPYSGYLIALGIIVIIGFLNGLVRGRDFVSLFFDVNAYLYFLLAPVIFTSLEKPEQRKRLFNVFFAGIILIGLKSLVMLGLFTHYGLSTLLPVYRWIRDTGVGEIAHIYGPFYRIFFQSQIFGLVGFLLGYAILATKVIRKTHDDRGGLYIVALAGVCAIGISLSRSFWVAAGASLVILFLTWLRLRVSGRGVVRAVGTLVSLPVVASVLILWSLYFPYPFPVGGGGGGQALVQERFTRSQPGITSRTSLLTPLVTHVIDHPVLGTGFATPITYASTDPRAVRSGQAGRYTTTAFEWGWLDIAVKMGLAGVVIYLLFLKRLLQDCWVRIRSTHETEAAVSLGLFLVLIGLGVTHIFSPYLNHPLGIGMVMLSAALLRSGLRERV